MSRNSKRLLIIFIYLVFFSAIGALVYLSLKPKPTCTDGKKNQGEEQVDCGGPCRACVKKVTVKKIKVLEKAIVYGGRKNRSDVLIKIYNPNDEYGISKFDYKIKLLDNNGTTLAERTGKEFILPKENKYIIEQSFDTTVSPTKIIFEMSDKKWKKFSNYLQEPELNVYNKKFTTDENGNQSQIYGLLKNESYFDFNLIKINIVLRDGNGKPIALARNEMRTLSSQEERDFTIIFPYKLPGEVREVEIKPEADVFNSDNFIKRYLPKQKFQDYGEK